MCSPGAAQPPIGIMHLPTHKAAVPIVGDWTYTRSMACSMYRTRRGVVPSDLKSIGEGAKGGMRRHTRSEWLKSCTKESTRFDRTKNTTSRILSELRTQQAIYEVRAHESIACARDAALLHAGPPCNSVAALKRA